MRTIILTIAMFSSVLTFAQNNVSDAFSKSYENEQYQKYDEAIKNITDVYDTSSYEMNLRLGWLTYLNGSYLKSVVYYQKSIQLSPFSVEARFGLAYPLAALNQLEDLIINYQSALKIDPKNSTANYRLASIYYSKKDFIKAENYAQVVLQLYPFDYDSLVLMGKIKTALGKVSEAKKLYNSALLYSPGDKAIIAELEKLK